MSFSRSRKAYQKARRSGDVSLRYSMAQPRLSEEFLRQKYSQFDLSLPTPSRPGRVVIRENDSDQASINRNPVLSMCDCEEDLEAHANFPPLDHSTNSVRPPRLRVLSDDLSKRRQVAFVAMICMVQVLPLSALGTTFPTAEIIAEFFNFTNPGLLAWTVAAYALTFGTFILIAGRLGDIFGHKRLVIIGFMILALSSLMTGLSKYTTFVLYFVARAFQGIGSATMLPNGLALLGQLYEPSSKTKNMAFALFGAMAPMGAYLGMLLGAMISQDSSWAWVSYALAFTAGICAILAKFVLVMPESAPLQATSFLLKMKDMDWGGASTGVTGLVCIAIAWVQAPSLGWSTQYVYMLLIIGSLMMVGFVLIEFRIAARPLVPFKTLKIDVAFILAAVGLGWASFGVYIFFIWQFLLHSRSLSPMDVAVQVLPVLPMGFVATGLTGLLMHTTRPALILCFPLCAFTMGALLIAVTPAHQTYWALTFVSLMIIPFGMDMSFAAATVTMSDTLPPDQQGIAASLVATVVNYGMSLGLGFASTEQYYVEKKGHTALAGYRGAFYVAIGLGGLGTSIAITNLIRGHLWERRTRSRGDCKRNMSYVPSRRSRLWSQITLTESKQHQNFVETLGPVSKLSHVPIIAPVTELSSSRESTDTLWDQHPAVRPLGSADLVARE